MTDIVEKSCEEMGEEAAKIYAEILEGCKEKFGEDLFNENDRLLYEGVQLFSKIVGKLNEHQKLNYTRADGESGSPSWRTYGSYREIVTALALLQRLNDEEKK